MGRLTFILGGARSGKSAYAQRLAEQHGGQVTFIATATAGDDEMAARILKHQKERPANWVTREIPHGIASVLTSAQTGDVGTELVLLDCLTLLVSNLLLQDDSMKIDEVAVATRVETEISGLLALIQNSDVDWIIISNEVGLGLVPSYPLGRIYRDLLGRANQELAACANEVFWMVAGVPVPIHAYREKH
jgi:adenosylcobinamide kinase / adenosylcobinamide-phosphate guanylyltransferase